MNNILYRFHKRELLHLILNGCKWQWFKDAVLKIDCTTLVFHSEILLLLIVHTNILQWKKIKFITISVLFNICKSLVIVLLFTANKFLFQIYRVRMKQYLNPWIFPCTHWLWHCLPSICYLINVLCILKPNYQATARFDRQRDKGPQYYNFETYCLPLPTWW